VPFILREPGSGIRLATEDYLAKNKVRIETRMEVGSNEAIKQAVKGELGLAVLSLASVAAEIERGELTTLDVHGFPLMRRWHVAYPSGKNLSHAATEFRKMLFDSAIVNYGLTPTK
jgi:DNA-binding transcriptional LysR family regulator